jgi:ABC-type Mn2+/Zn2+ transport system ATPase subunit
MVNPIPKNQGYRYIAIIGENAAGKSSMLNKILGLNLETGVDDTTQNIQRVS